MRIVIFFIIAVISVSSFGYPKGPKTFEFRELIGCPGEKSEHHERGNISASRINGKVVAVVEASLNCGTDSVESGVFYSKIGATLTITKKNKSGNLAICECVHKYEFTILNDITKNEKLYLVIDGAVVAETKAP